MAGHSKWHNIKMRKEAQDSKKGAAFTKLANAITIAAKKGGTDPVSNASLRLAITKAKEANMPKDKIENAINKANSAESQLLEEVVYEFYGPGGVAFVVKCHTDNKNRTAASVRSILNKYNMSLASPNSAYYIFSSEDEKPTFSVELDTNTKERVENICNDFEELEEVFGVLHN